tara:strand:+ start:246 stop:656 length:411 start_codon:yes stop_codon:yes gene_type:complete
MPIELLSLIGGGVSGFVFKLIGTMVERQSALAELAIKTQAAADVSADRAEARGGAGGTWVRRFIVMSVLFAIVGAPFILSFFEISTFVEGEYGGIFGLFTEQFKEVKGFLLVTELRTALLAIIGFYFGQSTVSARR